MKLIAPIIMVLVMIKCPSLMAQKSKVQFGLSTNFGIALFTNRAQLTDAYYASVPEAGSVGKHTFKLYLQRKSEYEFYVYLPESTMKFNLGFRHYHFQFRQDSIYNQYSFQSYGTTVHHNDEGLITIGISKRIKLNPSIGIEPQVSVGLFEIYRRVYRHSTAYAASQQVYHDLDDRDFREFRLDNRIQDLQLGSNFYYRLGWFNFNLGLAYYLYHEQNKTSHHGLYLNAGISVFFGNSNKAN